MSATLGNTEFFEQDLTRLTGQPSVTIRSDRRPVPLAFAYSETPLTERVADLLATNRAPIYLVYFTQRDASEAAQSFMSLPVCTPAEKATLQVNWKRCALAVRTEKKSAAGCAMASASIMPVCCRATGSWWSSWPRKGS